MAEIVFSSEAINDLSETKKYITEELCNEKAAINVLGKIMSDIGILSKFPKAGAPLSSIVNIETEYRFLVCGNYSVFYRIENDNVFVVRIIYGRRDFMRILFG